MADKKVNKISKTKIVKAGPKAGPKIVDKKRIAEGTEKRSRKAQKTPKIVKSKSTTQVVTAGLYDINGRSFGKVILPKEIFGQKPNEQLLAQAIRVYFTNQSVHAASTKTRTQVRGGGKKPWRQKGTGRARAGSIRSPLWVGGGVALGPQSRKVTLSLPKKMKRKALILALSAKAKLGEVKVISNIEKIPAKTKVVANLLNKLETKGDTLLVISDKSQTDRQNVKLATRNIQRLSVDRVANLNAYEVIRNNSILLSKEALAGFK